MIRGEKKTRSPRLCVTSEIFAQRAATAIVKAIQVLGHQPRIGRPVQEMDIAYRELVIQFGDSGYLALYRCEDDAVTVLSLRHQKEAGY